MAGSREFNVPRGMENRDIAKAFNAYLLGPLAFENRLDDRGQLRDGPYEKEKGNDADWQLDNSNDCWLHIRGNKATVMCRYPGEEPIIDAAVALFKARFLRERKEGDVA